MHENLIGAILTPYIINRLILLFTLFMGALLLLMAALLIFYSNRQKLRTKRKQLAQMVVQKAIFYDSSADNPYGFYGYEHIRDRRFREVLVTDIISARKNLTGSAFIQLKELYERLHLEKYALRKLNSPRWHVKAQAIQELAALQLEQYVQKLSKLINHPNELVRMETQTALLQLRGFEGLEFLYKVSYPISDWQQIKLLHQLQTLPPSADTEITNWLRSENDTVCILAIRIIKQFHLFQLHDALISCLDHSSAKVRKETIIALKDIYTAETGNEIKKRYPLETPDNQLSMIQALQFIGTDDDIAFLKSNIPGASNELKIAIIRAIAAIDHIELTGFEMYEGSFDYPLPEIVRQIKEELV